jgi:polygalacturonase
MTSVMPDSVFNVCQRGAQGDGQTLDTKAIQSVIDACAEWGGGTVYFPAGRYVTGSLFLRDNITLHLDAGAVILGSENAEDYPVIHSRWE